ncbi:MAG: helix-turn-helix transcriptional regulator [Roseburia sp.]|nr:helix-turn-helix transcriptional regulator [Roseburia sp.]
MTQNERVKEIRQTLKLTLEKFGEPIGLKKSALSLIENGKNSLTDANIKAICREFGVDYIWLTTGEGEMFVESDDEFLGRIDQIMAGENEVRKNMIKTLLYASDDDIEAFDRLVDYYYTLKYGEEKKTDGT